MKSLRVVAVMLWSAIVLLLLVTFAFSGVMKITHSTYTCTTTSGTALAAQSQASKQTYVYLKNDSDTTLYLSWTGAAVANTGIRLAAAGTTGDTLIYDRDVPQTALRCINGTGSKVLLIAVGAQTP